ncbi:MAG: ACT domain-containing protein [Firmicutes bacterium]|nr:ACT domain-containing protein [Bacillota bacterium]
MTIKQISVFLENRPGTLAEATDALYQGNINMRALSVADTRDFGILRFIADDEEKALAVLKEAGYATTVTDVLAAIIPDDPGSMSKVLHALAAAGVNVEYTYAFLAEKVEHGAVVVLRVDDADRAAAALAAAGIALGDDKLFG